MRERVGGWVGWGVANFTERRKFSDPSGKADIASNDAMPSNDQNDQNDTPETKHYKKHKKEVNYLIIPNIYINS